MIWSKFCHRCAKDDKPRNQSHLEWCRFDPISCFCLLDASLSQFLEKFEHYLLGLLSQFCKMIQNSNESRMQERKFSFKNKNSFRNGTNWKSSSKNKIKTEKDLFPTQHIKNENFFLFAFLIMERAINTSEFAPTKQSQQWW